MEEQVQSRASRLGRDFPIPLARIMAFDECDWPGAIDDALGDRYLCSNNPVFASIRRAVIRSGYRFSARDGELWRDYRTFGLTTLHRILSGKVIPYVDSAVTLRRLLATNPGVAISPAFLLSNLAPNRVFHESAHCVVHSLLESTGGRSDGGPEEKRHAFVVNSLIGEAFANTVEILGSLSEALPVPDALFYPLNSYVVREQALADCLKTALQDCGEKLRFTLYFLASFEANLSSAAPGESTYQRLADAANTETDQLGLVRRITDMAFGLSTKFRATTTPQYFALLGYGREFSQLAASGWLGQSGNIACIRALIEQLVQVISSSE